MSRRLIVGFLAFFFLFTSCATTRQWNKEETVTIALQDRTKIKCRILDVDESKVTFQALDREMGYRYGESVPVYWVRYIELADGSRLSPQEYLRFIEEGGRRAVEEAEVEKGEREPEAEEGQPVTAQKPPAEESATGEKSAEKAVYQELAELVLEAGLGGTILLTHDEKDQAISEHQRQFLAAIANSPRWQEKKEDLVYLSRLAKRSLFRVYLYSPRDLQQKLDLSFDPDEDMNFLDLMRQLHNKLGERIRMAEFRTMVEVVGEKGAKAIRDILANYGDWLYVVRHGGLPQEGAM